MPDRGRVSVAASDRYGRLLLNEWTRTHEWRTQFDWLTIAEATEPRPATPEHNWLQSRVEGRLELFIEDSQGDGGRDR
jgi:hypothetical protein